MTAAGRRVSSLRLAARLARRETRRRPGRTLLVALLVAVPVAGMVVATVWVRTGHRTAAEQWHSEWGTADLYATVGTDEDGLRALLPPGTKTTVIRSEFDRVLRTTGGARARADVTEFDTSDPMVASIVQVLAGRAPTRPGEVFLGRRVAAKLGVGVGSTLTLERPANMTWTVVGVGERRAWWDANLVVLAPGTPFSWRDERVGAVVTTVLADLPDGVDTDVLTRLSQYPQGIAFAPGLVPPGTPGAMAAAIDEGDDGASAVRWSWVIGAVVLTVVGIVIAAAFAAGARRQLATLGQLAANGASPQVLRRVLFLQGTWTGILGSGVGLVLAAAALAALAPHVDDLLDRDVTRFVVRPGDLVPIVVLGIAAATIAALVPARTTSRVPVLAALAGRRPLRAVPAWLTMTGVAVGAAGLALLGLAVLGSKGNTSDGTVWALTAIVGGVAILLGACAIAPGYVSLLEPLAGRLRGASRLAARSLARQRTRTGAVVSAVCATSALAIAAASLVAGADAKDRNQPEWMRPDEVHLQAFTEDVELHRPGLFGPRPTPAPVPDDMLAEVGRLVPGSRAYAVPVVAMPRAGSAQWQVREFVPDRPGGDQAQAALGNDSLPELAAVADETVLDLYRLSPTARRALATDGIVAIGQPGQNGRATLVVMGERVLDPSASAMAVSFDEILGPITVPVVAQRAPLGPLPRVVMTRERAQSLGLEPAPGPVVLRAKAPLTERQRTAVQDTVEEFTDEARDAASANGGALLSMRANVAYPRENVSPRLLEALLAAFAFVLSVFVVAVSLGLAAAETRDERDVLVVVGAKPSTMRDAGGHKALLLTILGAFLAVPVGFLPVAVFTAARGGGLPLVFPWRVVLLLVVVVPVLAGLVTTVGSGLALRLRPVRVSTMAFD